MKTLEQKPFLPYVTKEQIQRFDPQKPETHTASALVNAVLDAFFVVRPLGGVYVARYLNLAYADMRGGLKCATGLDFPELQALWTTMRIWTILHEEPRMQSDELAHLAGLGNRSSLWKFLHKHKLIRETYGGDYEPRRNILSIWREDKRLDREDVAE